MTRDGRIFWIPQALIGLSPTPATEAEGGAAAGDRGHARAPQRPHPGPAPGAAAINDTHLTPVSYVSGKLQTRRWRKDGESTDRYSTEILLVPGSRIQFLDKRNGNGDSAQHPDHAAPPPADGLPDTDAIPF